MLKSSIFQKVSQQSVNKCVPKECLKKVSQNCLLLDHHQTTYSAIFEMFYNFWKTSHPTKKSLPDPPKKWKWGHKKKSFPESTMAWTFWTKNRSNLVYFGLWSLISDLHPPIGGHHPVLYFPSQKQRNIVQRCVTIVPNMVWFHMIWLPYGLFECGRREGAACWAESYLLKL